MVTTDPIQVVADLIRLKTCSVFYFKKIKFFQLVLGLGWVYLATQAGHHFTI
jgi:hypothetical protein